EQADTLTEVDPAVAFGSPDVWRQMIAADELYAAIGNVIMGSLRTDEIIVLHLQSLFFPAAGFADHVKKRQMAFRPIREMYFVHVEILLVFFIDERLLQRQYHLTSNETTGLARGSICPQFLFFFRG